MVGVGASHKVANGMAMAGITGVMVEDTNEWVFIGCLDNCLLNLISSQLFIIPTH